jgi:hypothetical protein
MNRIDAGRHDNADALPIPLGQIPHAVLTLFVALTIGVLVITYVP